MSDNDCISATVLPVCFFYIEIYSPKQGVFYNAASSTLQNTEILQDVFYNAASSALQNTVILQDVFYNAVSSTLQSVEDTVDGRQL